MMKDYKRINKIVSTLKMRLATQRLPEDRSREVILYALANSRHQFHWSWIAKQCNIPESDWPPKPAGAI